MKRIAMIITVFLTAANCWAGQGGNGGDTYETRFKLARDRVVHALNVVPIEDLAKDESLQQGDIDLLKLKRDEWLGALQSLKVDRSAKPLYNEEDCGKKPEDATAPQKAACAYGDENKVILSIPYFDKVGVTPDEAFVLAFHESGHLIKEKNHQQLDRLGFALLNSVSQSDIKAMMSKGVDPEEVLYKIYRDVNVSSLPRLGDGFDMVGMCFFDNGTSETNLLSVSKYTTDRGPLFNKLEGYTGHLDHCGHADVDYTAKDPRCDNRDLAGEIKYDHSSDAWTVSTFFGIRGYGPYIIISGRGGACYFWKKMN